MFLFCIHKKFETTYVVIKLNVKMLLSKMSSNTHKQKELCLPLSNSFGEENGKKSATTTYPRAYLNTLNNNNKK